ncbi:ABC-three component system protein [Pseudomonas alliivorans]|nr:ABC-three component system protein [Pseudomonas alliivorans]MEE5167372.1 ABC-three component system protein [Pseudomonas alliivorans]
MSMITWVRKNNKTSLVLFVHGLKGGQDTWDYDQNTSFPKLLSTDPKFVADYDIACFNYFTTFTNTYGATKSWMKKIFGSSKKLTKNLSIDELSELLRTELFVTLDGYKKIIIVAHSMGGLVTKSCILKLISEDGFDQIKGFISLAVPHGGAAVANIGAMIVSNVQIKDLAALSTTIDTLSRDWIASPSLPPTKYIYGSHDNYVNKASALAIGSLKKDSIAMNEDHSSICKPKNTEEATYQAVLKYILDFDIRAGGNLKVEKFKDENQYEDHIFVIKMFVAGIHDSIKNHAKEFFYNAELARKIFTSDRDRDLLDDLYQKIKTVYQQELEHHVAHSTTSDQLISSVHAKIMEQHGEYLKSIIKDLDLVHKKGMLHQLANQNNQEVIWSLKNSSQHSNVMQVGQP